MSSSITCSRYAYMRCNNATPMWPYSAMHAHVHTAQYKKGVLQGSNASTVHNRKNSQAQYVGHNVCHCVAWVVVHWYRPCAHIHRHLTPRY